MFKFWESQKQSSQPPFFTGRPVKKQVETKELSSLLPRGQMSVFIILNIKAAFFFCFPESKIFKSTMQSYVMEPKNVKCCFPDFLGTFMYNRTVVSQPGAWEVSAGFPTESSSCLSRCYGCRLFSQWALCEIVCVRGELGIVVGQI